MTEPVVEESLNGSGYWGRYIHTAGWIIVRIAIRALPIMVLWNLLVPSIFPEMGTLEYGQAFIMTAMFWIIQANPDTYSRHHLLNIQDILMIFGKNQLHQNSQIIYMMNEFVTNKKTAPVDVDISPK